MTTYGIAFVTSNIHISVSAFKGDAAIATEARLSDVDDCRICDVLSYEASRSSCVLEPDGLTVVTVHASGRAYSSLPVDLDQIVLRVSENAPPSFDLPWYVRVI